MNEATIKSVLYNFFTNNVTWNSNPLLVIFEEQAAPRPDFDYGTIRFLSQNNLGGADELRKTDGTGMTPIARFRTLSVSFKTIGESAFDNINQLNNAFNNPVLLNEMFYNDGLSVMVKEAILNITVERDTEFEPQYVMDVLIGYADEEDIDTGYIEKVQVQECITENMDTITIG